jgi:hypothetical protein
MRRTQTQDGGKSPRCITAFERRQITVEALGMDERTVEAAYATPDRVSESTLLRVNKAAKALGLPTPMELAAKAGRRK